MDTREFFAKLYGNSQGKSYIWTLPDKRTRQADTAETLAEYAETADQAAQNVYFSVGLTRAVFGQYERAKTADIIGIPGLWADIDTSGEHAAGNLPPDYAAARSLLPAAFDPSIVVFSGHGIHVYYLFREMLSTETEREKTFATELLKRLQGMIRTNAATHGWHVDSVPDLCRVLRVPGTMNRKGSAVKCEVAEWGDVYFNPEDFDDALPPLSDFATASPTATAPGKKFERRATDGAAKFMLDNCAFLQYFAANYKNLPEPVWKAACTNIMRGTDGEETLLPLVKNWLKEKYDEQATRQKLAHYLNDCQPQTCEYIRQELNFQNCAACEVKSPCAWSLGKVPQAIAKIRAVSMPTPENTLTPEFLKALNIVEQNSAVEFAKFENKCRGNINLNTLRRELKKIKDNALPTLTVGQKSGDVTALTTVPDTPLDLRIPPNFSYRADGVYEVRRTDYGLKETLACGQPIIITRKVFNLDTHTEKIELAFLYYGHWVRLLAKRSEVFSARGLVNLTDSGLNASSESAKYLIRYLQALETVNNIPMIHAVSKIGWRSRGVDEFVLPSVNDKYLIDIDDDGDVTAAFRQTGTLAEWLSFGRSIRACPYARFMLAASLAAPLLKIMGERNSMVYFWGTSGGGKTAAMYFAVSVWGDPDKLVRSFYGTTNGIERAAEYTNDFPLAINERQVMTGSNRQEALEALVYMLEGGRGKVRASKSGLRSTATWRTISLATGEEPLSKESSVQGVKARMIEVNTYPVLPNELGKSVYAFTRRNHGTAGAAYIERLLAENKNGYREIYRTRQEIAVKLARDFPEALEPHLDAIAFICTADFLASRWLFGLDGERAAEETYALACKIAREMPTKREVSDTARAWDFIGEWLASNEARFSEHATISPAYGFISGGYYCVYPTYLTEALTRAGFPANKIFKELADQGKICTETEPKTGKRRFKVRVRHDNQLMRVIKISLNYE